MRTPLWGIGPPGDNEVFGLIMGDNHRYAMWDAAYVLGSLSASDRREFELHMAGCPACREAVAELSGVPALLSQLDHEEVAAIDRPAPITSGVADGSPGDVAGVVAVVVGEGALAPAPHPHRDLGGIGGRGRGARGRRVRRCPGLFLGACRSR